MKDPDSPFSNLRFDLGMPHLGRNNLSESELLKVMGHHRWKLIQDAGGVPSARIHDDAGERLYATFFFIDLSLPPTRPLSAHGENETLDFETTLCHHGKTYLDGRYVLVGDETFTIRSSNVFIYQEQGPSKLSVSFPANLDFSRIPEIPALPDSVDRCREAKMRRTFLGEVPGGVPVFEGSTEYVYEINPDRDLNGAGLLYFANYVCVLDVAERRVLRSLADPPPESLLDARSTYRRLMGYFGNAQAVDRLHVTMSAGMRALTPADGAPLLDLGFDYAIRRSSDGKEILISSSRKVAPLPAGSAAEAWAKGRGLLS
jgi:probable biosynthetic protein (TIGR04098 family)